MGTRVMVKVPMEWEAIVADMGVAMEEGMEVATEEGMVAIAMDTKIDQDKIKIQINSNNNLTD